MMTTIDTATLLQFLALLGGGGTFVYLAAQIIKRVFGLQSTAAIHMMVVAVTAIYGVAQYMLTMKNMPVEVLGISGTSIWGISQAIYKAAPAIVKFLGLVNNAESVPAAPAQPALEPVAATVTVAPAPEATPVTASEFNQ